MVGNFGRFAYCVSDPFRICGCINACTYMRSAHCSFIRSYLCVIPDNLNQSRIVVLELL